MKTLKFQGHSDDSFGEYGVTNQDVNVSYFQCPMQCVIRSSDEALVVVASYGTHPFSPCWTIGLTMIDEDVPFPKWDTRFSMAENGYSPILEIDVPDDFTLEWFVNGEKVKNTCPEKE